MQRTKAYLSQLQCSVAGGWNTFWFESRDSKSLCALRLAIGLITLYWLATLSFDLVALFGPDALVPSDVVKTLQQSGIDGQVRMLRPSILHEISNPTGLWVVHCIALTVTVSFTLGLFTRISAIATLVAMLTYLHRAPMITTLVEPILAFSLFYLCFAPCGKHFSIDAWLRRRRDQSKVDGNGQELSASSNITTRLLQIHTALVYLMMGVTMLSSPGQSWWFGDAIWFLIARPDSRIVDLTWLHEHVYILNAWAHWVVMYELAFAVLIWHRMARPILVVVGILHWPLLAMISGQAPFCFAMLALNLVFVDPTLLSTRRMFAGSVDPPADGNSASG